MKVMIVDDSSTMRKIIRRALRQAGLGAHTVEEASDGTEALAALEGGAFDLVLTDWNMPQMSGLELVKAVKAKGLPVKMGFVTSESTQEMHDRALEAGALFLVTKPFTRDAFQAALAKAGL